MHVREFRTAWHVAPNAASKYMEIIKSFFDFSVANGWIAVNPAKLVKAVKSKYTENEKERIPFTDEEIRRMFDACENQYGKTPIRWARDVHHRAVSGEIANYRYKWTGQGLADFISVSMVVSRFLCKLLFSSFVPFFRLRVALPNVLTRSRSAVGAEAFSLAARPRRESFDPVAPQQQEVIQ